MQSALWICSVVLETFYSYLSLIDLRINIYALELVAKLSSEQAIKRRRFNCATSLEDLLLGKRRGFH